MATDRSPLPRVRESALRAGDRLSSRFARAADVTNRQSSAVDLAVAAALAATDVSTLLDPAGFVELLRKCWEPLAVDVHSDSGLRGEDDDTSRRFDTLLGHLRTGVAALPSKETLRIALVTDELLASRVPYERARYSADVGIHAALSSSFGHSARILTAVVRFLRTERVVEVGTAYGLSALFLSAALARGGDGRLTTIEAGEPQISLAFPLLKTSPHGDRITTVAGRTPEVLPDVFATSGPCDFFFHDGDHSRDAYLADFDAAEPHLVPGAVVMFDDVRWVDPFGMGKPSAADGWDTLTKHPRVRRSVELDDRYGLLLLR